MFDFGLLTLPLLGAVGLLGWGVLSGPEIVIEPIVVPHALEEQGYTSEVVTRRLADEVRRINAVADSTLRPVNVDVSQIDRSYNALTDYFELKQVIDAVRQSVGLVPFYFAGDVVQVGNDVEFRLRAYPSNGPVMEFSHRAPIDRMDRAIVASSFDMMKVIDPYVTALYTRAVEERQDKLNFPATLEALRYAFTAMEPSEQYFLHLLWARVLQIGQKYDDALKVADVTIELAPEFANGYYAKARILVGMGRLEQSLAYFQRGIALKRTNGEMYVEYSNALQALGRNEEALAVLRQGALMAPQSPDVHHARGQLLAKMGRRTEAMVAFREAIAHTTKRLNFFDDYRAALLSNGDGK